MSENPEEPGKPDEPEKPGDKNMIRRMVEAAKKEYAEFGGWDGFKSGEWLFLLIQKSFRNYWQRATAEYFQEKYRTTDAEKLAPKLIAVAAKNAALLGGVTGAAMSANEVVALTTGFELGLGLPANIAIAGASMAGETIALIHFQLQLVANIGRAYAVPLDPDDPEDILTILAFALGGSAAEAAGKFGMRVGGKLAGRLSKTVFQKEVLAFCRRVAAQMGVRLLQRNIVKYTVPLASIAIGAGWNYVSTRTAGKIATKHFKQRLADLPSDEPASDQPKA
jgi:uncharacterized protein (DUF697 family)